MEEQDLYFEIKDSGNFVRLKMVTQLYPEAELNWDRDWIDVHVDVKAGAFNGSYKANMRLWEISNFAKQLRVLHEKLAGEARLEGLEGQVNIQIEGDGIGHFVASCILTDRVAASENKLEFELEFDQTDLAIILNQLHTIENQFSTSSE